MFARQSPLQTRIAIAVLFIVALPATRTTAQTIAWQQLPSIPDAKGFASPVVGVSSGALVVAGGANFPDQAPWAGGVKRWYDDVYVLDAPNGKWYTAGKLPRPLGYAVSLTTPEGIVCLGGSDAKQHYAECFLLRIDDAQLVIKSLPPLPQPCANACGAQLGRHIYLAGGLRSPMDTQALKTFWSLDLDDIQRGWQELPPWPGSERMLSVAGVQGDAFYLFSGASLYADEDGKPVRRWLRDAFRYSPKHGWKRIADLPRVAVAAPSPAPAIGPSQLWVLGGDDGRQVSTPPGDHRGFSHDILSYNTLLDRWSSAGKMPFSLVTTSAVRWRDRIVVPGGEEFPAVRSTRVWSGKAIAHP